MLLDVGEAAGWSAKDIAEAAVVLGSSKVASFVLVLAALVIIGRYFVQPWLAAKAKEKP